MPVRGNIQTGDWLAEVELSVDVATHASGDLLAQAVEIEYAVKENGITFVQSVVVIDYDGQGANLDLLFWGENPDSLGMLNSAIAMSDGVSGKGQGHITVNTWGDMGAQQWGTETSTSLSVRPTDGGTSIWVAAVSRGTGTYAKGKLTAKLGLLRG